MLTSIGGRKTYLWGLYLAALLGICLVSFFAASAAFLVFDQLPDDIRRSGWIGYLPNFAAPLVGGALFGLGFVSMIVRADRFEPTVRSHLVRTVSWYAFAIWVLGVMYAKRGDTDLGLWVQIILWPLMGTVGALFVDVAQTVRRRGLRYTPENGVLGG